MNPPTTKLHSKLRGNVSIEPRWHTTLGAISAEYLMRDMGTGFNAWLTQEEAAVAMALRYIPQPSQERVQTYVTNKHQIHLSDETLTVVIQRLQKFGLLEEGREEEDTASQQVKHRREVYEGVQLQDLKSVATWLAEESPYYSRAIRENGGLPKFDTLADVTKLPRLPKLTFRAEMANLHTKALTENRDAYPTSWATSSGTSGNRVQTLTDPNRQKRFVSDCTWFFVADSLPTDKTTRSCVLTTPVCSGTECHMDINRPIEERLISDGRRLILNSVISPAVATERQLRSMSAEIEEYGPNVLRGAGSYLAALARYYQKNGITPPKLDYVILGWELNSRIHRRVLRDVFGCRVIDEWGATEFMPIASQCEHGRFHVANEHLIEIVCDRKAVEPGKVGQILVTSLRRHATPLLRYEIGDLARASDSPCPCGNPTQTFDEIEGRTRDCVFTPQGAPVTPREVDNVVSGEEPRGGVEYYSLVQRAENVFKFIYVPSDDVPEGFESNLHADLSALLGGSNNIDLTFEKTKEIYPSNSGKFRLAYQEGMENSFTW